MKKFQSFCESSPWKFLLSLLLVAVLIIQPIFSAQTPEEPLENESIQETQQEQTPHGLSGVEMTTDPDDDASKENSLKEEPEDASLGVSGFMRNTLLNSPGLAKNDVNVNINYPSEKYKTYTDLENNQAPHPLAFTITLNVTRTGTGDENIVKLLFHSESGQLDEDYFEYPDINGEPPITFSPDDPVIKDIRYSIDENGIEVSIVLKDDIRASNTAISLPFSFTKASNGSYLYDGKVYNETELAQFSHKIISNNIIVTEGKTFSVKADSAPERSVSNLISSNPLLARVSSDSNGCVYAANLPSNGQIIYGDQRIINNYFYRNNFSSKQGENPEFIVYFPAGTELISSSLGKTLEKGDDGNGVFVPAGTSPNVPEGYYYILNTQLNSSVYSSAGTRWLPNYGGKAHRCEVVFKINYRMPDAPEGSQQKVYYDFAYTSEGSDKREHYTADIIYTIEDDSGWDFYFKVSHTPGVSGTGLIPISSINPGQQIHSSIRAAGFGFTHVASQKNQGTEPVREVKFVLRQMVERANPSYARANFTEYGKEEMQLRVSRGDIKYPWCHYMYYYNVTSPRGTRQTDPVLVKPEEHTDPQSNSVNIRMYGFGAENLEPDEYVESIVVIPYGTAETPESEKPGNYAAKNSFHISYFIGAWPNGHYPAEDPVPVNLTEEAVVRMTWTMDYFDANLNKMQSKNGGGIDVTYTGETSSPVGRFISSDLNLNHKEPGSIVDYTFVGYNKGTARAAWEKPEVILRLPAGTKVQDTAVARYGNQTANVTVTPIYSSDKNYNLVKLSGMDDFSIGVNKSFEIDFSFATDIYLQPGVYNLDAVLTSGSNTFIITSRDKLPLPDGLTPDDYGLTGNSVYTHFKDEALYPNRSFTILPAGYMRSDMVIYGSVTPPGGSRDPIVAAEFGSTVKVELEILNMSNVPYTNFSLFDILPRKDYLGSNGTLEISNIEIDSRGSIYYTDTVYDELSDVTIPIDNIENDSNWYKTRTKNSAAIYVDFGDAVLYGGEKITVTISFLVPEEDKADGNQVVFNQYKYTLSEKCSTALAVNTSDVQGFSTHKFFIDYKANPGLETEIENIPDIQSKVFLKPESDFIVMHTQEPERRFFKFLGWSTDPDTTAPASDYAPGSKVNFSTESDIVEIFLYPVWKAGPVTFVEMGEISFGTHEITTDMNLPWESVKGFTDQNDVGLSIANYTNEDKDIFLTVSEIKSTTRNAIIPDSIYYKPDAESNHIPLYTDIPEKVHVSKANSGLHTFPWVNPQDKDGVYFKQLGQNVYSGEFKCKLKWSMEDTI